MARFFGAIVQVDERFILIEHQGVELPIVIEVADGQSPAQVLLCKRPSGRSETSVKLPPGLPTSSCRGIVQGIRGLASRTWPLVESRSSQPSLLTSGKATPKP